MGDHATATGLFRFAATCSVSQRLGLLSLKNGRRSSSFVLCVDSRREARQRDMSSGNVSYRDKAMRTCNCTDYKTGALCIPHSYEYSVVRSMYREDQAGMGLQTLGLCVRP